MEERLCSVDSVAVRLSIGRRVVERMVATGQLKSVKIGRRRLIPESAVNDYLARLQESA